MMNRTAAPATTPPMTPALAALTPPPELLLELDPDDPPPSVGAVGLIGEVGVEVEGLGVGMSLVGIGVGKAPVGIGVGLGVGCFVGLGVGKPPVGFGDDVGTHVSVVGIWDGSWVSTVPTEMPNKTKAWRAPGSPTIRSSMPSLLTSNVPRATAAPACAPRLVPVRAKPSLPSNMRTSILACAGTRLAEPKTT